MILLRRAFRISFTLFFVIGFNGCGAGPEPKSDTLDPRLAWPCDRLVLAWSADAAQLQKIVGANLIQRSDDGVGQLQLSIMQCDPPGRSRSNRKPLTFAYVTVPVTADSVPLVITSIPTDGWLSLPHVVTDPNSTALFTRLGYEVMAADISFAVNHSDREYTIEVRLDFDNGHISVVARAAGESIPHEASKALLVSGADYLSAFFGQENARRYSSVSATVQLEGETPLSTFDLPRKPSKVVFDRVLRSDRIFWRLPIAEQ